MSRGIFFFLVGLLMALGGFAEPISVNERPTPQIDFSKADYDAAVEAYEKGTASRIQASILKAAGYFAEIPVIDYAGGPDGFGYRFRDSSEPDGPAYQWVDITNTGTRLYLDNDSNAGPLALPFTFNFYGTDFIVFYVHDNGAISFTDVVVPFYNNAIPTADVLDMIAPFWIDAWPEFGEIWYGSTEVNGMDAVVVSYLDIPLFQALNLRVTFQVILLADGSMLFHYNSDSPDVFIWDSIGIQADGSLGLFISYEDDPIDYPYEGLAIEIYPGPPPDPPVVSGYVYDDGTGDPIPGATVEESGVQYTTDANGYYEITGLVPGPYSFYASAEGYYDQSQGMTIVFGPNTLDWYMVELPPVIFLIEPVNEPVVPPEGGTIEYNVYLTNTTQNMWSNLLYWTEVLLPNGNMYGPIIDIPFSILPFMEVSAPNQTLTIPPGAPAGEDYVLFANVGRRPGPHLTSDFSFLKLPSVTNQEGCINEWSGSTPTFLPVNGDVTIAAEELPTEFIIAPVYPNPFNSTANVSVALPKTAELKVSIFNVMGQKVAELADGQFNAGVQTFTIDGSNLASGIYFVKATVPGQLDAIQKVTLMK